MISLTMVFLAFSFLQFCFYTLKKIGVVWNPKNGKNNFDGAAKPKKVSYFLCGTTLASDASTL